MRNPEVGDKVRFLGWGWDRNGNAADQGKIVAVDPIRDLILVEETGGPRDGKRRWHGVKQFVNMKQQES